MNKRKQNKWQYTICKFNGVIKMEYMLEKPSTIKRIPKARINQRYRRLAKRKLVRNPERGGNNMETVMTKQGLQYINSKKSANAIKEVMNLIGQPFKSDNECKEAEEEFRKLMQKKGYTRF